MGGGGGQMVEFWNTLSTSFTTELPTCYQYVWKTPAWIPSGPGALRGLRLHNPSFTSNLVTLAHKVLTSSVPRKLGQLLKFHPILGTLETLEEKSLINPLLIWLATSLSPWIQFPRLSLRQTILFLLLRIKAEVWKNLVFLSPCMSQLYLDFTDQNSSSY